MIKKIILFIIFISIVIFFYLIFFEYFSDKNKLLINKNRIDISKNLSTNTENLPILENDTNNIIEFNVSINENNNKKQKRKFWKLLEK
jgi:heme/copper-type cytochrome/quinol oxidase subunit 1